jgi:hypothetical protein
VNSSPPNSQVGEHANDYAQIAAKDKLTELQLRVRQLLDQVEQITKEQNYQRYREERFRATSESTNRSAEPKSATKGICWPVWGIQVGSKLAACDLPVGIHPCKAVSGVAACSMEW